MTEINITEDEYLQESKENIIKTSEVSITPVKAGLLLLLVIITIFNFTSVLTFVPTESMADEIQPNDILYASKLPYLTGEPERFDIIIFKYPLQEDTLYIKRIIGLPGEYVEIKDGHVYINGKGPLVENYLPEEWTSFNDNYVFKVPDNSYLVLGDNRNYSFDARFWREEALAENICNDRTIAESYAYVEEDNIVGKAITKLSPTFEVLK